MTGEFNAEFVKEGFTCTKWFYLNHFNLSDFGMSHRKDECHFNLIFSQYSIDLLVVFNVFFTLT